VNTPQSSVLYPQPAPDAGGELRRAAAERAVTWVKDGMVLGFGTGRSAGYALEALARRVQTEGLRIAGVPSSRATEARARALGLPLTTLDEHPELDLTIDGADEVDPQLNLIKGGGGALLREKVLAAASRQLLIVVEGRKLVPRLGTTRGVPLEILPFAAGAVAHHLVRLGGQPQLRPTDAGRPFVTDNGNWIIDCRFPPVEMETPASLEDRLGLIPGLLECGLFCDLRPLVVVGEPAGVRVLNPAASG
jgi:ribose 5-phosphate isomerase A